MYFRHRTLRGSFRECSCYCTKKFESDLIFFLLKLETNFCYCCTLCLSCLIRHIGIMYSKSSFLPQELVNLSTLHTRYLSCKNACSDLDLVMTETCTVVSRQIKLTNCWFPMVESIRWRRILRYISWRRST